MAGVDISATRGLKYPFIGRSVMRSSIFRDHEDRGDRHMQMHMRGESQRQNMVTAEMSRANKGKPLMLLIFVGRRGREMIGQIFEEREIRLPMVRNVVLIMKRNIPQLL